MIVAVSDGELASHWLCSPGLGEEEPGDCVGLGVRCVSWLPRRAQAGGKERPGGLGGDQPGSSSKRGMMLA